MKRFLLRISAGLFAALFLLSGYRLLSWYWDRLESRQEFERVEALLGSGIDSGISGVADDGAEPPILGKYRAVYEVNKDFVGWITIEDTKIDYPVMQSPEAPDYYLKHSFEKEYRESGVPYMQWNCELLSSDNLILYGHSMKDGTMFAALKEYKSEEFYREHALIRFDSKYSCGVYEVVAAFATTANEGGFRFNSFVNAKDQADFDTYIKTCKELTPYEIEATAQYGDRLLTLSTCEYTHENGRMVVVARKIENQA